MLHKLHKLLTLCIQSFQDLYLFKSLKHMYTLSCLAEVWPLHVLYFVYAHHCNLFHTVIGL